MESIVRGLFVGAGYRPLPVKDEMKITVKLFATLLEFSPNRAFSGAPFEYELPDDATLADLVAKLHLPDDLVKVMFVNGIICESDRVIMEGDSVGIFPPVGGGCCD